MAANAEKNRALMLALIARPGFKERNREERRLSAERRYGAMILPTPMAWLIHEIREI
jgi:hypothetical protein